jgi:hypothetical protein
MKTLFSSTTLLGAAICISTGLLIQPSNAANSCVGSDFNSGPGNGANCPSGWNTVSSGGVSYTINPISFATAPANDDELVLSSLGGTNINFQYQLNPTIVSAFTNSFTYTIAINTPGYTFDKTQANATGSNLAGGFFSTTTSNPSNYFSPRTADPVTNPSSNTSIAAGLTSLVVKQEFSNAAGGSSLSSVGANYTATPGPLPIAGAGLAFGFSRKLRRRIRQGS